MKLGTEDKKKVYILSALGVVALYLVYTNVVSDSSPSPAPKSIVSERNSAAQIPQPDASQGSTPATTPRTRPKSGEFRPAFRSKRPEDRIDPLTVDPTLRTDLLAKVQAVKPETVTRNLFQFGAAPPAEPLKGPETIVAVKPKVFDHPRPDPPPVAHVDPPPPPEPPIDVKYYGLATKKVDGKMTAFFIDGDNNIILAPEGGMVKRKYRVVRIGQTSVLMENTDNKKQQSVPLAEDAGANFGN